MPNSLIQSLTTTTETELNDLPPFTMTTLLGLVSLVDSKHPEREVRTRPSTILDIIKVGKSVEHGVTRAWTTQSGTKTQQTYRARRYSPRQQQQIHLALLELHNRTVQITSRESDRTRTVRQVHLLDSFGYVYERNGSRLDLDDLPAGLTRHNVNTPIRPVWRLRRRTAAGDRTEQASAILFRLNTELANEISNAKATIGFTLLAPKVFPLLRRFAKHPAAIRLLLLILRQVAPEFTRCGLAKVGADLGFPADHFERTVASLEGVLNKLINERVVEKFRLDREGDRLQVWTNRDWYREDVVRAAVSSGGDAF